MHQRYNTAVAEVGDLDLWQSAKVGFAVVSNSPAHADSMLNEIISFVEDNLRDGVLADVHTELISS